MTTPKSRGGSSSPTAPSPGAGLTIVPRHSSARLHRASDLLKSPRRRRRTGTIELVNLATENVVGCRRRWESRTRDSNRSDNDIRTSSAVDPAPRSSAGARRDALTATEARHADADLGMKG